MDLNEAVYAGREDIVINLLNSGRDVNMNPTGTTALMTASSWATKNMVRLLLERGADVNIVNRYNGSNGLNVGF
jgi:Ankyrin repeat.